MRRLLIPAVTATFALLSGSSLADPGAIPGASGTLWVTERTPASSTVTAFDAATGEVLGTTPVGPAPIGITQPSGTGKVYTSDENADQLSVIAKDTITVTDTIPMGDRPHHLMASPNGEFIYVAEFNTNQIGVVDTSLDARIAGFTASVNPGARTHAVWITRDGKNLFATNAGSANTISKLDATTGAMLWEIAIGNNPSEILVTPDGKTAYISLRSEHRIQVVDVSGEVPLLLGSAEAQREPDTLSLTNNGKTLVVGLRASPTGRARMGLIDTGSLATTYVEMPGHTTTGHQWLSANGRYTFIAVESPGAVAVIDNDAASVVTEYPYPNSAPRPHGVFYEPSVLR